MPSKAFINQWFIVLTNLPKVAQGEKVVGQLVGNTFLLTVMLWQQARMSIQLMAEAVDLVRGDKDDVRANEMISELLTVANEAKELEEYLFATICRHYPVCRGHSIGFRKYSEGIALVVYDGPVKTYDTATSLAPGLCPQS